MGTNTESDRRIVAIDFFSGAGGLSHGLNESGIKVLAGVDIDEGLRATYEANHGAGSFVCADINEIDIHELRDQVGVKQDDVVVYAACTPCQPFSTLNRMSGEDPRRDLLISFGELVKQSPPDFVIVENVPGLRNAIGRQIHQDFLKQLEEAGFTSIDSEMVDASDYGVPQIRKRFLLLASRHGEIKLPPKAEGPKKTVREAIGNLPAPVPMGQQPALRDHVYRPLKDNHTRIIQAVPKNGGSRSDVKDTSILLKCHQRNPNAHRDVFGRMSWDLPSPTLTCRCTDVYCGRFAHPEQDRGMSLKEAALLQSFPSNYVFEGSFAHIAKQIGNAVPFELAKRIGLQVKTSAESIRGTS